MMSMVMERAQQNRAMAKTQLASSSWGATAVGGAQSGTERL
jgi:hypothetical protein